MAGFCLVENKLVVHLLSEFHGMSTLGNEGTINRHLIHINNTLQKKKLPSHNERTLINETDRSINRCCYSSFSKSLFNKLQILYCKIITSENYVIQSNDTIFSDEDNQENDEIFDEILNSELGLQSHILCHASEGYYIPLPELVLPMYDSDGILPGSWFGSSHVLLKELVGMCPCLGIDLVPLSGEGPLKALKRGGGFDLSENALKLLKTSSEMVDKSVIPLDIVHRLRHVWFVLYEAARVSILHNTAILLQ